MFVLARAATYSVLFIGCLLIFLPGRILSSAGVVQPTAIGAWQAAAMAIAASGAALALTCILTFVFVGRGDSRTVRPASPAGGAGAVPTRPKSDVSGCRPCACRRRALLPVGRAPRLYRPVPCHQPRVRGVMRGTSTATDIRWRLRSLLSTGRSVVAEAVTILPRWDALDR